MSSCAWLECGHEDVCATVNAVVNNAVLLQLTHQSDAASNHSHPALFF